MPPVDLRPEHNVLIRKLRSISPLSDLEQQSLLSLPLSIKDIAADEVIVREGGPSLRKLSARGGLYLSL
jgi:hypothetical protein